LAKKCFETLVLEQRFFYLFPLQTNNWGIHVLGFKKYFCFLFYQLRDMCNKALVKPENQNVRVFWDLTIILVKFFNRPFEGHVQQGIE
jgi:hypothetical protein